MRTKAVAYMFLFAVIMLFAANTQLFAQSVILTDTEVKEDDTSVQMLFSTNRSIPVECYDLSEPPQVVVDFMGEIYSNKPEVTMINKGVVKQIRVVKGTKKSSDLDETYYSVDFIIVDLTEAVRYDFDQGLTNSVLLIAKPGKPLASADVSQVKPASVSETTAPVSMMETPETEPAESISTGAEQEEVVSPESVNVQPAVAAAPQSKAVTPTAAVPESEPPKTTAMGKVSKGTKAVGSEVSQGVGKVGSGLKNLFTFGKKKKVKQAAEAEKKTTPETVSAKPKEEAVPAKPEVKAAEKKATPETVSAKPKEAAAPAQGVGKVGKGVKDLFTFGKKKKTAKSAEADTKTRKRTDKVAEKPKKDLTAAKKEAKPRRWKKQAGEKKVEVKTARGDDPAKNLESARQNLKECETAQQTAQAEVAAADKAVEKSLEDQRTIGARITEVQQKQKIAEDDMNNSLKQTESSKAAANSVWLEYSSAKNELANLLNNPEAEDSSVVAAQERYDAQKAALEKAINNADQAKKASDEKAAAYEAVKKQNESLCASAEAPAKNVALAQKLYEQKKEQLIASEKKITLAKQEVADAERAYQQYKLQKADEEYKKSLKAIDSSLAAKLEEDERELKAARERKEQQKRAEEEARQQKLKEERAMEEARLEALKKLQETQKAEAKPVEPIQPVVVPPEETVQAVPQEESPKTVTEEDDSKAVTPKRRQAQTPVKKTPAPQSLRAEVLKSAVELRNAGLEMQRTGDTDSAVKYYQQALMQDPNYATVHNDLGILYEQMGLEDKAKTEYLAALKIDPYYIRSHSNLALLYERLGDYNKAYYHWKQRVQLGKADDPWTQKARERMEALEKRK